MNFDGLDNKYMTLDTGVMPSVVHGAGSTVRLNVTDTYVYGMSFLKTPIVPFSVRFLLDYVLSEARDAILFGGQSICTLRKSNLRLLYNYTYRHNEDLKNEPRRRKKLEMMDEQLHERVWTLKGKMLYYLGPRRIEKTGIGAV